MRLSAERGHLGRKGALGHLSPTEQTLEHGTALRLGSRVTDFEFAVERRDTHQFGRAWAESQRNESAHPGDLRLLYFSRVAATASGDLWREEQVRERRARLQPSRDGERNFGL